jgi:uncharacterized protein
MNHGKTLLPGMLGVAIVGLSINLSAASFDCCKASGCVEEVICQSPQPSRLDSEMADLYFSLRRQSSRAGATQLLDSQRAWLRSRNTCGCDANCLVSHYNERIRLFLYVMY